MQLGRLNRKLEGISLTGEPCTRKRVCPVRREGKGTPCLRNHLPYPLFKIAREPDVITGFEGFFLSVLRLI